MNIQALYKRLSMPLLLTVISATGLGVSTPARSASLLSSQNTAIDAKSEAMLIAEHRCGHRRNCNQPPGAQPNVAQPGGDNPTREPIEKPEVEKPEVEKPEVEKPVIEKPEVEKPVFKDRTIYQRQRLQQHRFGEPSPAHPFPQN